MKYIDTMFSDDFVELVITCSSEPPEAKYSPVLEKATALTRPCREGTNMVNAGGNTE